MSVYLSVVFCQVEVSAPGRSQLQRIPTECDVSEYGPEDALAHCGLLRHIYIYIYFKHVIRLPIKTGCSKSCFTH